MARRSTILQEVELSENPSIMRRSDFTVAWICALSHELAASRVMLDEEVQLDDHDAEDDNTYIFGQINSHNVVLVSLPKGETGKSATATVVKDLCRSFPELRFGLLVGIGGGIPDKEDIRLGDVVVSQPCDGHGGVIQYDFGKVTPNGVFERRGHLNKPPKVLLSAVSVLQTSHDMGKLKISEYIKMALKKFPSMRAKYSYPGNELDSLYESGDETNVDANPRAAKKLDRQPRLTSAGETDIDPRIFYGLIGSGDSVIASSKERKILQRDTKILCVEMEAAGLMDSFPCLVIRGICDYADSQKRDQWQCYAAMVAAAYAKELLETLTHRNVAQARKIPEVLDSSHLGSDSYPKHDTNYTFGNMTVSDQAKAGQFGQVNTQTFSW